MRILLAITACAMLACSDTGGSKEWVTYTEPDVFSIRHPEGWRVDFDDGTGWIRLVGTQDEAVSIWPVYSQNRLEQNQAAALLMELAAKAEPQLSWGELTALEPRTLRLEGRTPAKTGVASLNWVSNRRGTAAFCYVVSAPPEVHRENEAAFADILASFRPVIPAREEADLPERPRLQFVRWQDPQEGAFMVEVPQGWRVEGGLVRYTATDYREGVNLVSPDGEVNVFFMDPGIPFFTVPNQTTAMLGLGEGNYYTARDGSKMLIRRYVPGAEFSREYATNRFSRSLNQFSIQRVQNRADIARVVNQELRQLNAMAQGMMQHRGSAGEVYFRGQCNGKRCRGYVAATTVLSQAQMSVSVGIWEVRKLYGFVAPEARIAEAVQVMARLVSSFRWHTQWYMQQHQVQANVTQIMTRSGQQMAEIITSSFELGQSRTDRALQGASDYFRGTITLRDESGQEFNVWNTSKYYWVDAFDDVAGSELFENPDPSRFRRLVEVR